MLAFSWQDYSDMCFSIYNTGMIERDCALVKDTHLYRKCITLGNSS